MSTVIIDSIAKLSRHVEFNFNFIKIIKKIFSNDCVIFMSEINYIKDNDFKNITGVETIPSHNTHFYLPLKISYFFKLLASLKNIYTAIKKHRAKNIFVMECNNYDILACFILKLLFIKARYFYLFHGEVANEFLKKDSPKLFTSKFYCLILKKLNNSRLISLIFLEKHILDNISRSAPFIRDFSFIIDHPIDDISIFKESSNKSVSNKPKIGYFGTATIDKGFPEFIELAYQLGDKFDFLCCTRDTHGILDSRITNGASINFLIGPLSESPKFENYMDYFKQCDFVVLLFKDGYYNYAASGVLCDCIRNEVPVLGIKNTYIQNLIDKHGNFGIFFDSVNDMFNGLKTLKIEKNDILFFKSNLRKIKESRSFENSKKRIIQVINYNAEEFLE